MTFTFKADPSHMFRAGYKPRSAAARQFRSAAWNLADLIRESSRVGDRDIQCMQLVQDYLEQMKKCASASGSLQLLTHLDDVWLMAREAFKLYLTLYDWIEHCYPSQLDPKTRDHASFAGTVIDHLQSKQLNILENWPKALFIEEEGPRWHFNPELFTELRDACEKSDHDSEGNAKLLNEQTAELKAFINNATDRVIAAKAPKRKKKFGHEGNGLKGPKTTMMKKQKDAFFEYLRTHPVTSEHKRTARAHQCWLDHPEWKKAAGAQGDAKGYASHKSLAAAK